MTEEKLDELTQQLGGAKDTLDGLMEDEEEDLDDDSDARGDLWPGSGVLLQGRAGTAAGGRPRAATVTC